MPKKVVKKPVKATKKLFKMKDTAIDDILLGAGITGGLLGLGYLTVIAPKLKKKRMEAMEVKEELEIKETVMRRIQAKVQAAKEKMVGDAEKITETYSVTTTPRTSITPTILSKIPSVPQSSSKIEKIKEAVADTKSGIQKFTSDQKQALASILKRGEDVGEYVSKITGRKYIPSNIKLSKQDPIRLRLHVIEAAARGYSDSDISRGLDKLRKSISGMSKQKDLDKLAEIISKASAGAEIEAVGKKFKFPTLRK